MTLFHSSTDTQFSPALLALQRFIRGTLQQVGIGLAALLIILNLGAPTSALPAAAVHPHPQQPAQFHQQPSEKDSLKTSEQSVEKFLAHARKSASGNAKQPQTVATPELILQASMTQHHLTRARLTIPTMAKRPMVSMAEEK